MDKIKYIKLEQSDGSYSAAIPLAVDSDHVDVNGNTLTDEINNKATKAEVQAVASGSPAGVYATVAALTTADPDHSKIYLVSADGKWYYWDSSNSVWIAGGIYQSRGIENNEITFDNLQELLQNYFRKSQIELGTISNINGTNTSSTNRVRTNQKYYLYNNGQIIGLLNKKFNYAITYYNHSDKSYVSQTGWLSNSEILSNLSGNYDIRFIFRKIDNSDFTFADIIELSNSFFINEEKINKLNEKLISDINLENLDFNLRNNLIGNINEFKYIPNFIVGNILTNGSFMGSVSNDNKTTVDFLEKTKISFTLKTGFMSKITYYNDNGTFDSQSGWTSAAESDIVVSYTILHKAKITIASITAVAIMTYNINEMIENFVFQKDNDIQFKTLKNNFIHFSFDDVTTCLSNLKTNYNTYISLWDEPFFKFLYDLHQEYGAKFSLYTYQENMDLGDKFKQDFINSNSWLKIGWHAVSGGGFDPSTSAETVRTQYETFITNAYRITGGLNSIDRIPRLDYYKGTRAQVNALRDAKCGIYGVLTADDDRTQDYLTTAQHDYLLSNNNVIDPINGLYYYRTNFRLDWFVAGFSSNYNYNIPTADNPYDELVLRYNNPDFANLNNNLIIFTHEWQVNVQMKQWIEDVCRFAKEYGYQWEYIQNKVENIKSLTLLNN